MDSEVVGSAEISALIVHSCSHAVAAWPRWVFPGRIVKADLLAELVFERLTVSQEARPAEDAVTQVELVDQDPLRWEDLSGDHPGWLENRRIVAPDAGHHV